MMLATLLSLTLAQYRTAKISIVDASLPDLLGNSVRVLPSKAKKGVVAFFVLANCPNANAYAPEMNRIARRYGPMGWKFYLVFTDSLYNLAELQTNAKQFGYTFPVLHGQGELLRLAKATKSPEAAVFSRSGHLLYDGRIDDRFYALGKQRSAPTQRDLRAALDAVDAGKPVPHSRTDVVGCFIPID
jgi:hypothetical protein